MKTDKVVLFDIDYTLFDSDTFRKKVYQSISEAAGGYDSDSLQHLYASIVDEYGYFNPNIFFRRIAETLSKKEDKEKIKKAIWKKENFEGNFFKETLKVLLRLTSTISVGVFSKGKDDWQLAKIAALEHVFDKRHIHITVDKHATLPSLVKKYMVRKLYLVDDALDVLHAAKQLNRDIFTIWVKRGRYAKAQKPIPHFTPDAEVFNLRNIVKIVTRN